MAVKSLIERRRGKEEEDGSGEQRRYSADDNKHAQRKQIRRVRDNMATHYFKANTARTSSST